MNVREKLRCCGIVIHTNRRKQFENAPDKLQWHPAFCAAAGLEFHEDIERLELKPEYNLSKEPIRIDLLIKKGVPDKLRMKSVTLLECIT